MHAHGYPGLDTHVKNHRLIIDTLKALCDNFNASDIDSKKNIGVFIKDHVMTHILTEDRKLGVFLKGLGLA